MLDFEAIKQIPVADVATGRYHLQLAHKGRCVTCACPLPKHRQSISTPSWYGRLKSEIWRTSILDPILYSRNEPIPSFLTWNPFESIGPQGI